MMTANIKETDETEDEILKKSLSEEIKLKELTMFRIVKKLKQIEGDVIDRVDLIQRCHYKSKRLNINLVDYMDPWLDKLFKSKLIEPIASPGKKTNKWLPDKYLIKF